MNLSLYVTGWNPNSNRNGMVILQALTSLAGDSSVQGLYKNDLVGLVMKFDEVNLKLPLRFFGHSFGATASADAVNTLYTQYGIVTDTLVLLDPVRYWWSSKPITLVPGAVKHVLCLKRTKGWFPPSVNLDLASHGQQIGINTSDHANFPALTGVQDAVISFLKGI